MYSESESSESDPCLARFLPPLFARGFLGDRSVLLMCDTEITMSYHVYISHKLNFDAIFC